MARNRGYVAKSGAVHNKEWEASFLNETAMDLAIGTVVAFALFSNDRSETLLRTRGEIFVQLDAAAVAEDYTIAVGICIASARAVAAGAASLPRPGTDGAYPWIWHGFLIGSSGREAAINNNTLFARLTVDSKAMRKMKETEDVVLVFEMVESTDQTGQVRLMGGFRALVGF